MDPVFQKVIHRYEELIRKSNRTRHDPFGKLEITVLGQQGLLIRREKLGNLRLLATTDFDAHLKGEPPLDDIFKRILREEGLSYDEDSQYIWLPEEVTYEHIYESDLIKIVSPAPIYLILSKAVKAPEKNRQLVIDAINEYGDELIQLMEKYKADFDKFV